MADGREFIIRLPRVELTRKQAVLLSANAAAEAL